MTGLSVMVHHEWLVGREEKSENGAIGEVKVVGNVIRDKRMKAAWESWRAKKITRIVRVFVLGLGFPGSTCMKGSPRLSIREIPPG